MPEAPSPDPSAPPEARPTAPPTNPSSDPASPPNSDPTQPDPAAEVLPDATPDALRAEVRRLRDEAATGRVGARRADALAQRLVEAQAAATGLLADPTDLRFDPSLLDDDGMPDPMKVAQAVAFLLDAKPHLASRTPRGDIAQGARDDAPGIDLAEMLRAGA